MFWNYLSEIKTIESEVRKGHHIFPKVREDFSESDLENIEMDVENNNSEIEYCDEENTEKFT